MRDLSVRWRWRTAGAFFTKGRARWRVESHLRGEATRALGMIPSSFIRRSTARWRKLATRSLLSAIAQRHSGASETFSNEGSPVSVDESIGDNAADDGPLLLDELLDASIG